MYMIYNHNSDPQVLETRENLIEAKELAQEMSKWFSLNDELLVLDPYGKDVHSTNMGAFFRYRKA